MSRTKLILLVVGLTAIAGAVGGYAAMRRVVRPVVPPPVATSTWDRSDPRLGEKAYVMCQACHGLNGHGILGYAPGLAGSAWLNGDSRGAILITLHGYDATSEPGAAYVSSRMLGHGGQMADHEIAAVLTWARQQWGNAAPAIPADEVTTQRGRYAGRTSPWSPAELRAILKSP